MLFEMNWPMLKQIVLVWVWNYFRFNLTLQICIIDFLCFFFFICHRAWTLFPHVWCSIHTICKAWHWLEGKQSALKRKLYITELENNNNNNNNNNRNNYYYNFIKLSFVLVYKKLIGDSDLPRIVNNTNYC